MAPIDLPDITTDDVAAAEARMTERRGGIVAVRAGYDRVSGRVRIELSNGVEIGIPAERLEGLSGADAEDLETISVTPAGTGLHFPALDADIYVPALLQGVFGSRSFMAGASGEPPSDRGGGRRGTRTRRAAPQS